MYTQILIKKKLLKFLFSHSDYYFCLQIKKQKTMKKLTPLVLAAAFGALTFTSCKKDYTCDCKVNGESVIKYDIKNAKKKDAEAACEGYSITTAVGSYSCSLN